MGTRLAGFNNMGVVLIALSQDRTHLALDKGTPAGREAGISSGGYGDFDARLGGHHRFNRAA
jgi:hypothetical protein